MGIGVRLVWVLALALGAHACSSDGESGGGAPAEDAGKEASVDATTDVGKDVGSDAPLDSAQDGPAWTPPYELPGSGQKLELPIDGRNVAVDVKPSPHSNGSWQYSLFQSYGGGSFSADYSAAGAYVLAGTGGHNAAPCFGAAIFDFTTGTWSYLPNANGFDENRTDDVSPDETTGAPYSELVAVTTPGMPAPAHNYLLQISPPRSLLGGAKGAIVKTVGAAQATNGSDSPQSHELDLATGLWSRASVNLRTAVDSTTPYTDSAAAYDPKTQRIYHLLGELSVIYKLPYLDLTDATWKAGASFPEASGSGYVRTLFVDDARRLLVIVRSSNELWAIDLENVAAGPTQLAVTGTIPTTRFRWELYPSADGGDGSYYAFSGVGPVYESPPYPLATDQFLHKLTPPASDPLSSPWVFSTHPIAGGLTAQYVTDAGSGAQHQTRFFYVPALRVFAWIPNGTGPVELIKP
jgi:hypothetical protein